jgi:hypothetical protein
MLGAPVPAAAQDNKVRVMVDWSPHGMHAGLHLAKQKGWFQEAGLDVEVLDGKGSTATIQQVGAGQIDVGFAQLSAMAVARSNGVPLTSIACFVRAGDNGVMVPKGAGYKTMKDLEGKRVAYAAASTTGPFMDAFLKASGTSRDKMTLVNVDAASLVNIYTSGNVDAVSSTVAFFLPIVEATRPSEGILWADVGLRLPGYGLIVQQKAVGDRAAMLQKFVPVVKAPAALSPLSRALRQTTPATRARSSGEKLAVNSTKASTGVIGRGSGREANSGFSGCNRAIAIASSTAFLMASSLRLLVATTPCRLPSTARTRSSASVSETF